MIDENSYKKICEAKKLLNRYRRIIRDINEFCSRNYGETLKHEELKESFKDMENVLLRAKNDKDLK